MYAKPTVYIGTDPKKVSLAEESWRVLSPFLCRYQWAFDEPSNSPRKTEIAHAILNRGKKGCCTFQRPEGYTCKLSLLGDWAFEDAIAKHRKIYYVSYGKQALLYFDIDLHYAWQKLADGQDAKWRIDAMLREFFGGNVLFWSPSSRGFNGYLKVDLKGMDYALANELFDRLEAALQLFLASCGNLADFEVKGKIGHMQNGQYRWADYGKLPIHNPTWNFAKLEEFANTPSVSIHRLGSLCRNIEAKVPHEVLVQHQARKIGHGDESIFEGNWFLVTPAINKAMTEKHGEGWRYLFSMCKGDEEETWLHKSYYRPGRIPLTEKELREVRPCVAQADLPRNHQRPAPQPKVRDTLQGQLEAVFDRIEDDGPDEDAEFKEILAGLFERMESGNVQVDMPSKKQVVEVQEPQAPRPNSVSVKVNLDLSDLIAEPDSLKRQSKALLRYARYLKRVPTHDEGMQLIHDHHLFTGSWEDNLARRKTRVRDILNFIGRSFDASKCANGHVNIGKFDEWAKKKFPDGLIGGHCKDMDEYGNIVDVFQNIHVSTKFIAAFMAVVEFALLIDQSKDNSVPHDRCEALWRSLKAKGLIAVCFNDRKWAVCREELAKLGIIAITDRDYCTGKAMRWDTGTFFPGLGLWTSKKQPGLMGPGVLPEKREKRTEQHNTFLSIMTGEDAVLGILSRSRPPP